MRNVCDMATNPTYFEVFLTQTTHQQVFLLLMCAGFSQKQNKTVVFQPKWPQLLCNGCANAVQWAMCKGLRPLCKAHV